MSEVDAVRWLMEHCCVSRETRGGLQDFIILLRSENERQNLVARATLEQVWARHIVDSAQLLVHAPAEASSWLDLGTGAGFPGLVVAMLHRSRVTLVEEQIGRAHV